MGQNMQLIKKNAGKRDRCPLWALESTNMINAIFKNAGKRDRCLLWALEKTTVI